jgi:diguanylate cyclase (GGDEF)-like protein
MVQKIYKFDSIASLEVDISFDSPKTLIQVFCAKPDPKYIEQIQQYFQKYFPQSIVIGATADGTIYGKKVYEDISVVSLTHFDTVTLTSASVTHKNSVNSSYESGKELAKAVLKEDTKVIIAFADGINTNGEEFTKGITASNGNVILSGGQAGDNGALEKTYVFDKTNIITNGAVAVSLSAKQLFVDTLYTFDWLPIGKELRIDKAIKNRVYEIDGMSAVEIYEKYLGHEIAKSLPKTGIEFPLIVEKDGIEVGRAVIAKHDDGSLTFAGNIDEGSFVRFGVGNAEIILRDQSYKISKELQELDFQPEAVFTYSCMARRRFLRNFTERELEQLNRLGVVSGFYTYGEFFHFQNRNELLNETMTLLVMSESTTQFDTIVQPDTCDEDLPEAIDTVHALANLANVVSKELEELNKNLEKRVKESADFIYKQAYFDKLTGLPNRLSLIRRLRGSVGDVIFLINIDDFTAINDYYGHLVGDEVLKKVAELLEQYAQTQNAQVYKLPSDEYVVLMKIPYKRDIVTTKIKDILTLIEETHFVVHGITLYIRVVIASALVNESGTGLANADMSLKLAKKTLQPYVIHDDDINLMKRYESNLNMAFWLKQAIAEDMIFPVYQPIVDANSGEIVKYEALVRMKNPQTQEILTPYQFLEVSQKIRLYPHITEIMIEKTFKQFANTNKSFSLNLAFDDILNKKTKEYLFFMIQKYNVAHQLTIEILETQEIRAHDEINAFIDAIYDAGATIAIDDFGSGFANFEYLAAITSDYIKIDGSLVKNIDTNESSKIVVQIIIDFAKHLKKKTIAEFVHSKEVYEIVKSMGVDMVQGYYLAPPTPEVIEKL